MPEQPEPSTQVTIVPPEEPETQQTPPEEAARSLPGVLMTHTTRTVHPLPIAEVTHVSEQSRIFPNGMPTNLDEIRPIISQAYSNSMSLTSWLNARLPGQQPQVVQVASAPASLPRDTFVINLDDEQSTAAPSHPNSPNSNPEHHIHIERTSSSSVINSNSIISSSNVNNNNNNNNNNNGSSSNSNGGDQSVGTLPMRPEAQEALKAIQRYLPFAGLLLAKTIYDHRSGTLCLVLLLIVFIKANNDLKREIAKQQSGSRKSLFHILCYIFGALAIISLVLNDYPFFFYAKAVSFWDLVWGIIVTDFVVKLFTIALKTLLTCLPASLLAFQKRGKYYLWMEAASQFYRSTIPMYSWMSYFKEAYQGPEVILGIIMASLYGATKIPDLLCRGKLLVNAFIKFWQNISFGSSPSKEQLMASGGTCVICHEEYSSPILLHCKHIFCEVCVSIWLDRERTCPLCRSPITDDPIYRDGHTTHFIQFY